MTTSICQLCIGGPIYSNPSTGFIERYAEIPSIVATAEMGCNVGRKGLGSLLYYYGCNIYGLWNPYFLWTSPGFPVLYSLYTELTDITRCYKVQFSIFVYEVQCLCKITQYNITCKITRKRILAHLRRHIDTHSCTREHRGGHKISKSQAWRTTEVFFIS